MNENIATYKTYRIFTRNEDWVEKLKLCTLQEYGKQHEPINVLVLYGSLRKKSYSRYLAYEFCRILDRLGADVRVFDPQGLPVKDDVSEMHPKVHELRELSKWSHTHLWVSPEQHGNITAVFKNQIDWIPLSLGSVRPTQGRTLAIAQVCGGSQSFNAVNSLRILGRWMRMFTIQNQSSVAKAWSEFDENGRMKPSGFRERVVDVAEELFKYTIILRPYMNFLTDRHIKKTWNQPLLCPSYRFPSNSAQIDAQLLIGSILFGLGWGLAGVCPGPAVVLVSKGGSPIGLWWLGYIIAFLFTSKFLTFSRHNGLRTYQRIPR